MMLDFLRLRKSAGVRVTVPVHRLIRRGDAARGRGAWSDAAAAYSEALVFDPKLFHIWIQLGHMSKEAGLYSEAADAYFKAAQLRPQDPAVLQWLYSVAGQVGSGQRRAIIDTLRKSWPGRSVVAENVGVEGETVFDVSDLISYFAKARLPTGIQRVQIETIRALIEQGAANVRVCCTLEGRGDWVEVPKDFFIQLAELSVLSGNCDDPEWLSALNALQIHVFFAEPLIFGLNAALVNLGTSWWLQNYFLQVRNAKKEFGIRYLPFVHDLIPVMTPEHCIDGLVKDFTSWILGVFSHADGYLVASHATERDLRAAAELIGHEIPRGGIGHVPLNADIRPPAITNTSDDAVLDKYRLQAEGYVLFVSTIESRKGHTVALDAWLTLINRNDGNVPFLVCVGNDGWLNQDVYARMDNSNLLRERVKFLSRISDADLGVLYRNCKFTIYPSLYEGWGLPITESLCYGKAVITCDNSSLVQAGEGFATIVETGSSEALADAVDRFCRSDEELATVRAHIDEAFRPRPWLSIGQDIIRYAEAGAADAGCDVRVPTVLPGRWYDLARNMKMSIWQGAASAEVYRAGTGWAVPDDRCAWIRSGIARLVLPMPLDAGPLRLLLHFTARRSVQFIVLINDRRGPGVNIKAGESRWVSIPVDNAVSGPVNVDIQIIASPEEMDVSIGVRGFAIASDEDMGTTRLLEALLVEDYSVVEAFGPQQNHKSIVISEKVDVS
jgi:glycosyltransferase involved in cell wall biosynthesis